MAMEVNGNYKSYGYLERIQPGRDATKEIGGEQEEERKDEYVSSEESGSKPSGLYRLGQDESGNPKVLYDDPKKAKECTTNTDRVDREIEKLKEEKKQLEQQISAAAGDEKKARELEKKLAQVEGELSQKDNDTYRRQNAEIS